MFSFQTFREAVQHASYSALESHSEAGEDSVNHS
jgi:hypothetical protein